MRITRIIVGTTVAVVAAIFVAGHARAEQRGYCAERSRQGEAIHLARALNTAQARAFADRQAYQAPEMIDVIPPAHLTVQMVAHDSAYIFTIKDEACAFGLFSDQGGLIYIGEAIK